MQSSGVSTLDVVSVAVLQYRNKPFVLLASPGFKRGHYYHRRYVEMETQMISDRSLSCVTTLLVHTHPCSHISYKATNIVTPPAIWPGSVHTP